LIEQDIGQANSRLSRSTNLMFHRTGFGTVRHTIKAGVADLIEGIDDKRGGSAWLMSACQHDEPHYPSSPSVFVGQSDCGGPTKFARRIAKVGRPTAQHSLSVRYALSLIEPPKATVAAPPCGNQHAPCHNSSNCRRQCRNRDRDRRLIVLDKTMLIYVGKRPLRAWPSGTGSDSELGFPSRRISGLRGRSQMFSSRTFSRG